MNTNKNRQYILAGYDVTEFIIQRTLPMALLSKPEWGEMPDTPRLDIELFGPRGEFSIRNTNSFLYGKDPTELTIEVRLTQGSSEIIEWSGTIETIEENTENYTTRITGISPFQKLLDSPALVTTGDQTPAQLSRNIFLLYNIDINESSYSLADSLQENLIAAQVDPNLLSSQITLMELQKQLAAAGYGRIYPVNGEMYYESYTGVRPTTAFSINERDLMTHPKITTETREAATFTVETLFGQVQSESFVTGDSAKNLDFGPNAAVKITSLTGGQLCADQWEKIDKEKAYRIDFALLHELGNYLDLSSYIELTWEKGFIFNEIVEIININRTDPRYTQFVGRVLF